MLFQLTFAAITAALISGAIADRVKLSSWIVFLPLWVTLCYFPIAHKVWGGGWLYCALRRTRTTPVARSCTSTPVSPAGVLALIIGRRMGFSKEPMRPHNLTLTMIGAGLLWFGWYGFNVGSIVFTGDAPSEASELRAVHSETGVTFMNTTLATWPRCSAGC